MNQAEVIHASFVNRDEVGVPLDTSAEFDVRDGMYLNSQLQVVVNTSNSSIGRGPTLHELNQRKGERELNAAKRKGEDLLFYGVTNRGVETNKEPPQKKPTREENMFDKRKTA